MDFYSGFYFYIVLFAALTVAAFLGMTEKNMRWYRSTLTALFIFLVYRDTPWQLICLLLYSVGSAYVVRFYLFLRKKFGRNPYLYGHMIFFALLPLILSKINGIYGKGIFGFLGLSYICFRVIQIIIECYDGVITEIDLPAYFRFILFFPTLSSGPIDRSRRFAQDDIAVYKRSEYVELLGIGLQKIILGMVYKIVLSSVCYELLNRYFSGKNRPLYLLGYAYIYGLYLFFDFAGYSSMAVGTGYILGIRTPDNFNKPFLSVDMKDFWNRWHITLSTWFRDFVFTRLLLDNIRQKRFHSRITNSAVALIVNMGIMGIWHGVEPHYIVYGLYHGVLLAATEIYQKKSRFYKKYKDYRLYRLCSWFLTIHMVMFGFLIFSGRVGAVIERIVEKAIIEPYF